MGGRGRGVPPVSCVTSVIYLFVVVLFWCCFSVNFVLLSLVLYVRLIFLLFPLFFTLSLAISGYFSLFLAISRYFSLFLAILTFSP